MSSDFPVDISVVICTRDRIGSLRETLACLAAAEHGELRCEITVVNNAGADCAVVAGEFAAYFKVHYLEEPRAGKAHALNRALDDAPLGGIVAVMDDDMSPAHGWFRGVKAICDRWPAVDLFTGRTPVIWPAGEVPAWCRRAALRGWAFSSLDAGDREMPLAPGQWYPGGHFWIRARVLEDGRRFAEGWTTEPQFMLQLVEDGYAGIMAPDAVCGHRVQPALLRREVLCERAARVGRGFAAARLLPGKTTVRQSRLLHRHPLLGRIYCAGSLVGWSAARVLSWLHGSAAVRFERKLRAIERCATYRESWRIAGRTPAYRIWRHRT